MTISIVSVNGNAVDSAEASISINERGFRFGDGVFESIPVHNAMPYLWEYHMERLKAGLEILKIRRPTEGLLPETLQLIHTNQVTEGLVRIYISRGIGSCGYLPSPAALTATTIIQTLDRPKLSRPTDLWLSTYEKISPRALPVHCKLAQGVNSTLARMEADEHGCSDALQLDATGHIAEASSANIFWLAAGKLYTPSIACGVLAGVTRRRIMELSPTPVNEGAYSVEHLEKADAVILTNAAMGIIPVKALHPVKMKWDSSDLAAQFLNLRNQDITKHTLRLRELLASS